MMLIKGWCRYCRDWRIVATIPRCHICHGPLVQTEDVPA